MIDYLWQSVYYHIQKAADQQAEDRRDAQHYQRVRGLQQLQIGEEIGQLAFSAAEAELVIALAMQ